VQGKASQLGFKTNTFDLIFCVNALHHFDDPENFIRQARHLLRPEGKLAIIGQVPQDRRNHWYVYDYFEGIYETDLERFPTWGNVTDWMVGAGFESIQWQPLHWIIDDKQGWEVLEDPFLQNTPFPNSRCSTRENTIRASTKSRTRSGELMLK
jgi:SAM-dependent methyltransferase